MSRQINQPINQVRLTNVAVVRMNKGGKRFEIACYRNKVVDYRKGLEADLDEVLQTDRIFSNVSKGQFAKHSDLQKVFGTKNEEAIARIILEKGQLQVSDLERQSQLENTLAQIATWVASHCVHPDSQRPYTISQIKHALGKQYQVQPHKPIKKQYLDCVKFLKKVIPIERAKMELLISYESGAEREETVQTGLQEQKHVVVSKREETTNDSGQPITKCVVLADPSLYRPLDDLLRGLEPSGKLEILRQVVTLEGDVDLEMEIERKKQLKQAGQDRDDEDDNDDADDNDDEDSIHDNNNNNDEDEELAKNLQKVSLSKNGKVNSSDDDSSEQSADGDGDGDDDDDNSDDNAVPMTRKQQKQKKKQSKKAKRRQKEEEIEQEERLATEQKQQEERRARVEEKIQPVVEANAAAAAATSETKPCNTCGGNFPSAAAYRAHFKSDWHRFNQKLKLQGMSPVSEDEFKLCDEETFFGGN